MRIFGRRPRMKVGKFQAPPPRDPVPLSTLVDEGMLIAESAIRMTLKNAIIVAALRDRASLDREMLADLARERIAELVEGELDAADRDHDEPGKDARRREEMRRGLAVDLEELVDRDARLAELVESARAAAWEEIASPIADRATAVADAERAVASELDPAERAEALATFVALDLTELAAERGLALE